jgi:1-pyrroline-5-carboxylate dehydrogenase
MANGIFKVPTPLNEPVKPYSPGSAEKKEVKAELKKLSETLVEIPLGY